MDQHPDDEQPRDGLEHEPSGLLAERRIRQQMAALTAQAPGHAISVEAGIPGRAPRFVAKAMTSDTRPYLVITTDLDELRRELTGPPAPVPLPRRVPGTSWTPPATTA
jgi:hypothetical protein